MSGRGWGLLSVRFSWLVQRGFRAERVETLNLDVPPYTNSA